MTASRKNPSENHKARRPPAKTPEAREDQMVSLAVELAEQQLRDGTASAQVITHYLKLGTGREKLEREKLRHENHLLATRADQIASGARMEELYEQAINAMRGYGSQALSEEVTDDDY